MNTVTFILLCAMPLGTTLELRVGAGASFHYVVAPRWCGHFHDDEVHKHHPPKLLALHHEVPAIREAPPQCRGALLGRPQGR